MFGPNWHGHQEFRQRIFERGDLKYVVLELLMEKPRHGYEIIRELGDRHGGFYSPSPGSVYPTLEMLLDMDYVTATHQDGKKIYAITDAGRAFVAERKSTIDEIRDRMGAWWSPELRHELKNMKEELRDLGRTFDRRMRTHWADPERLQRIHAVISQARKDIEVILTEERPAPAASGTEASAGGTPEAGADEQGRTTL